MTALGSPFDAHSRGAAAIASLFTDALVVSGAIFLLVTVLVFTCAYRFRARGDVEPKQVEGHRGLEIGWTVAPVLILTGLLVLTVQAMSVSDPPIDRAPDVTIIAHQWWWEVRYPSGAVTANEVHIPTGKPLVFRLESADVIHDFWVPSLGRKMDATPGHPTSIWLEADEPGTYTGACAEYCGVEHAWMRTLVVAEAPDAFEAWQRHELAATTRRTPKDGDDVLRGEKLFLGMACVSCHTIRGAGGQQRFAPDLTHLAERRTLGAGVLANAPDKLALWLKDPQAIKAGCHMPDTQLTDAQVNDLVAYFETLR
jgi:cytochrome c oxidase subunit 2